MSSSPTNVDIERQYPDIKQIRMIFDKMFEELRLGTEELIAIRQNHPERAAVLTVAMEMVLKAANAVIVAQKIALTNNKEAGN